MDSLVEQYTHEGVQRLIKKMLDTHGFSQYELGTRAGLTPSTIYHILRKKQATPPRKSTVTAISRAAGYEVIFDSTLKTIQLTKMTKSQSETEIDEFVIDIKGVLLRCGKEKFSKDEKQKILEVIRVLGSY